MYQGQQVANLFNVTWQDYHRNDRKTREALKNRILKYYTPPIRIYGDTLAPQKEENDEAGEPPVKRARVGQEEGEEGIAVSDVEDLKKLEQQEKEKGGNADLKTLHRKVFIYLESIRKTPEFLAYVYEPGTKVVPPPEEPGPSHRRLGVWDPDNEEYNSPFTEVRKLAPIYAYLGKWLHAFNCLSMPLYKPDAHYQRWGIIDVLQEIAELNIDKTISEVLKEPTYSRDDDEEEEEEEDDRPLDDDVAEDEKKLEDHSFKNPKSLKEMTIFYFIQNYSYDDIPPNLPDDLAVAIKEQKEKFILNQLIEILLRVCYCSMPRVDNEFGNKNTPLYMLYLKKAMGLAGLTDDWDMLYLHCDDELQLEMGFDCDTLFRPRKTYTSDLRPSYY